MNFTYSKVFEKKILIFYLFFFLCLCFLNPVFGQNATIKGHVSDEKGDALPGVTITVVGSPSIGTITDFSGDFSLQAPGASKLSFSYIGYIKKEIPASNSDMNVILLEDVKNIGEVVVVGYGVQKKINLTGSLSSVSGEKLAEAPVSSITQALAGRLPGLYAKNTSGAPGKTDAVSFNIRGFGTPLIILDGMPISSTQFAELNPNEIESLNVLKDAAVAAVYGAKSGNGVVLVTTKRGSSTKPRITYTGNFSLQSFTKKPEFANSAEYAEMENIALLNEQKEAKWSQEQINKFRDGTDPAYPNTDWWNLTFSRYAPQTKNDLSVQGGNEMVKYFIAGGILTQQSMLRSGDMEFKRYNLRSNLDVTLTKRLSIGLDISLNKHDYTGPAYDLERASNIGIMSAILRSRPYYPSELPDKDKIPYSGTDIGNPIYHSMIEYTGYRKNENTISDIKFNLFYKLPLNINFLAKLNYNCYSEYGKIRRKKYPFYGYNWETQEYNLVGYSWFRGEATANSQSLIESNAVSKSINQQYMLDWKGSIGSHNFAALGVWEINEDKYRNFNAWRENYEIDIDYLDAGPDLNKNNSGTGSESGRMGFVFRLNYNFKEKYLFEANARYDASSKFPKNSRWGFFPSVSAAWRISEENFIRNNFSFVDNLKIRASYGQLGYDGVSDFQYLSTYSIKSKMIANDQILNGIRVDRIPNPNITWEKLTTSNIGFDMSLWKGLFSGSLDYFYRKRSKVLGARSVSMPNVVGASLPSVNYAKYDNRGFELQLDHKNRIGDFTYDIGMNLTWTRQKTIYVDESAFANEEQRRRNEKNGRWTNRWMGYLSDGLFKSEEEIRNWANMDEKNNATILPGDIKIKDVNGDGRITEEDMVTVGRSTFPELMYGFNIDFNYKGFDFRMFWQGAGDYSINLLDASSIFSPFYAGSSVWSFWRHDAYIPENPWTEANFSGKYPRFRQDAANRGHQNWARRSDFWLVDGDYLRLKNLEIGYTLPTKILKRFGISNCRVYLSGNNLLTFAKAMDKLDPEIETAQYMGDYYPQTRVYNLGLTVSF